MKTTWINRGHFYCPHVMPVLVDCNFVVDSTNGNGLGIRSLKGQGIRNIFMHTSATPGSNDGYLNPNPAAGYIQVQFSDNYSRYYGGFTGFASPLSGSNLAVSGTNLTAGKAYVITVVGTSTTADWVALGVPKGIIPAVGVSFIAIATGAGSGSGQVQVPATAGSGIDHIEVIGDPNSTLSPTPVGPTPHVGGWMTLACEFEGALTAPAAGTSIGLAFYLSQSSVFVKGE